MFDKEIHDLMYNTDASATCPETLAKVVALMRAAQPKDAEAERAYCVQAIYSAPMGVYQRERWLLEQRAAARAEGFNAGCGLPSILRLKAEIAALRNERDALAAESRKLHETINRSRT